MPTYLHQVLPLACLHIWEQHCSKCATQIFLHGLCRTLWRCEESIACGCIRRDGTCVDVTICNSSDTKEHASCSGGGIECTALEIIEAVVAESALHDNGSRSIRVYPQRVKQKVRTSRNLGLQGTHTTSCCAAATSTRHMLGGWILDETSTLSHL